MKRLIITMIILTMTLSVSAQNWWGNKRIKGNGNMTTETRNTSDYEGVSLGGFFDVILVKGKEGKIKIEGEENLMDYIITEVSNGILKVKVKKGVNIKTSRRLTVTVPVKEIEKVSLGGSGNISRKTAPKNICTYAYNSSGIKHCINSAFRMISHHKPTKL